MTKITIKLTPQEAKYFMSFCILRAVKAAVEALPDDYEYLDELQDAGEKFEQLRNKVVEQCFATKADQLEPEPEYCDVSGARLDRR